MTGEIAAFGSIETPKSLGEFIGVVRNVYKTYVTLDRPHDLHNADGICFFDQNRNLSGTTANRVEGDKIYPLRMQGLHPDIEIYRNYDHLFCRNLEAGAARRKLRLSILLRETDDGLILLGTDEDANTAQVNIPGSKQPAAKKDTARQTIREAEDKARDKAAGILAAADDRIIQDTSRARKALEKELVGLVSDATEAIIYEKVDASKDAQLIERALKGRQTA